MQDIIMRRNNWTANRCMQKYLYLDFDGVLHPTSGATPFCRMPLLEAALAHMPCHIVISSSWRFHQPYDSLQSLFPTSLRHKLVGTTGEPFVGRWPRHSEILIDVGKRHAHGVWRAIDDSWLEFPKDCEELIRCNPNTGIGDREVGELTSWLGSVP